ncbi:MAG: insulinase family protein [Chitinophagaceae bacterium]|nr:insulinase family protein [Chitinophagaceae bacterium]
MKKLTLSVLAAMCLHGHLISQAKLVEKITKSKANEIVIPYEKYVYPNGLTLIVHEDHSDPIVHVDVTYHVGSAREEIGKSGFAHFFEHMMFQGSDHVADEQHFKIITEAGGTLNGTTNRDRTNYFETVPSNQLEKMLWLESDRMGYLLDAVTQKKFEVQRATVKNERGQNYDNRPYGLVQETISKNLFPYGHPYSWLTIGYVEDLNRVDVQDLKNFFMRWYGPNNAVITIGGDVKTSEVTALVEKYFGKIPMCPKVEKTVLPSPELQSDRYVTLKDGYAKLPMLVCTFPSVPAYSKDEAALDMLAEIIGGDNTSMLYQRLVKTQKATRASAGNSTDELAGTFQLSVTPKSGGLLKDMEAEVRATLKEFETRGVTDEDLTKFKNAMEASRIYMLESVSAKVSQLASFQTFTGNANYIGSELKRYADVTKEDIINAYNKYIKNKPMVILSVVTKGNESNIANTESPEPAKDDYTAPDYGYAGLTYNKVNDFDRSVMPKAGANPVIKVPDFNTLTFKGETVKALHAKTSELPMVVLQISLPGGRVTEQANLNKAGLLNIFSQMMEEDTRKHSAEEMSVLMDNLGTSINVSEGLDEVTVSLRCLKKNLKPSVDLLVERMTQPLFKQETFDRIKNNTLENIKNSKTRAAVVASSGYSRVLYGSKSILGYPSEGTTATVSAITLQDVENYYNTFFNKDNARIVVVGDLSKEEASEAINQVLVLPSKKNILPTLQVETKKNTTKTAYVIDIPKAAQTEFRIGYVTGLKYDALGEYYKCGLMNYPLGGAFNSRINLNLREDKGWTYGARSGFNGNDYTGNYTFSSGIKTVATDSALNEVMNEMIRYSERGISEDELSFLKNAIGQSDARKYETGFQKAGFLSTMLKYNLKASFVDDQNAMLTSINAKDINTLAKKWIQPSSMFVVLAGDKEKIQAPLEKAGYQVIALDPEAEMK